LEVPLSNDSTKSVVARGDGATGAYYDSLSRWTGWLTALGYGGGRRNLTAHRALADPRTGGRPTFTRLHDVLASALPSPLDGRVGTMLDLAARGHATFVGLTLSEEQAAIGRRAVAKAGLGDRIAIRLQSYDTPPAGPFDGAIAIESLAHSPGPAATLAALAGVLSPGGWLAVIDDVPEPAARGTRDLEVFQAGWRLPVLLSAAELVAALAQCRLTVAAEHDLTADVRPRTRAQIARLETLNRLLFRIAPAAGARVLLDSYHGGLALERLYRDARMRYRLIVARKAG
jgi:SAM-dependent methyltransferase